MTFDDPFLPALPPPPAPPPKAVDGKSAQPQPIPMPPGASEAAAKLGAGSAFSQDRAAGLVAAFGNTIAAVQATALRADVKPLDVAEATTDLAKLQADFKLAKTPLDVQTLAKQADELQGRLMVSKDRPLPEALAKQITQIRDRADASNVAVASLQADHCALASPKVVPGATAVAVHLLANPGQLQQNVQALGALDGSPLAAQATQWANGIAKLATPQFVGEQLAKNPDIGQYPASIAADLGKLRALNEPNLQAGLDVVGKGLLVASQAAQSANHGQSDERQSDPLSYAAVRANPALGQLLGPLQSSQDPTVRAQLQGLSQNWVRQIIQTNLDANRQGAPVEPRANATNSQAGIQRDLADLAGKTGLGPSLERAVPEATKAVALDLLNRKDLTYDALKQNPAYGQVLAQVKDDPAFKGPVNDKMRALIGQGIAEHMAHEKRDKGVKDGMGKLKDDLVAMAKVTGLGQEIGANVEPAMHDQKKAIEDATNRGKGFMDHLSDFASGAFNDLAKVVAEPFKLVGSADAAMFNAVGLHGLADASQQFSNGIGDGLGGTVSGFGTMVAHPMQAAKGLGAMILHPSRLEAAGKAMYDEAMKGGLAHGLGYAVGALAPTLLGGGSAAGLVGRGVESLAAADIPVLSGLAIKATELGELGLKGVAMTKAALGGDALKTVDVLTTAAKDTSSMAEKAEVGEHSLVSAVSVGSRSALEKVKSAGEQIKGVTAAEEKGAAAKALARDSFIKAKDKVVGSGIVQDKVKVVKAIRTPKQTARELVDHLKSVKTAALEARQMLKGSTEDLGQATKQERLLAAGGHLANEISTVVDSSVGKLGQAAVAAVQVAISPGSFLKSRLPGALFQSKLFEKGFKQLNFQTQSSLAQANQVAKQADLASALDIASKLGRNPG